VDVTILYRCAVCLGLGALVQSTLGFGMGVAAIPLLVYSGLTLPEAIGALIPNVLMQTAFSCWQHRRHLPWAEVLPMSVWRWLFLPLGVWLLSVVNEQGEALSRALLGAALLGALAFQEGIPLPVDLRPGRWAAIAAGTSSGLLAGLIGMGGPTLVLWVMSQDWEPRRQRCFLWLSFLLVMPLQIALMLWEFGRPWAVAALHGAMVVPVVLVVAWMAGKRADRWSKHRLRQGMRLFLLLIAARLIWQWAAATFAS
jgi:uncharacterized membrane protein YfcA